MINVRKAAIIGCGFVGSSIAFSLMQRGLYSELVLIDANQAKAEGEAMDLSHGLPYAASMQIYAGTYDDVADCAMVILTAGANQKPGETRLDLIDKRASSRSSPRDCSRASCWWYPTRWTCSPTPPGSCPACPPST